MAEFKLDRIRFTWKGNWTTNVLYTKDDIVRYGGKSYVCLVGHTASSNFYTDLEYINTATEPDTAAPKWTLWFDGYEWKSNWNFSTFYNQGDVVRYHGYLYICITEHTSTAYIDEMSGLAHNDSTKWSAYLKTDFWTGEWLVTTAYQKGDIVRYGGTIYRCIITHQSDPLLGFQSWGWEIVTQGVEYKYNWTALTVYKAKDIVKYGADIWLCTTDHTSIATFQTSNWTLYVPGVRFRNDWLSTSYVPSDWVSNAWYTLGDIVQYGGAIYRCILDANIRTVAFTAPFIWELITSPGTYVPGDIVGYGGYNYISKTHNTGAVPSTSTADWTLLTTGFRIKGDWSTITQYFVGDVVRRNGQLYVCIIDNLNNETTNTTYWTLVISGNEWQDIWISGSTYVLGDLVLYNTSTYRCILKHTAASNNNPIADTAGTYWNPIVAGATNEPMTTPGDTISYQNSNIAVHVGTLADTYKANTVPYWEQFGVISNVFYVAPTGTDSITFGTSLEKPFKTIKYACDYIASLSVSSSTLFIKTGTYSEILPITVVAGLELVGDEIRSTVVQPATGYTTSNMFLVRNGSGIRNMTLSGLSGTLGTANSYETSRPTAGAYVSLDPGTGPADSSVWITTKSPYVQNVSTFGTGCVGLKVDGTLHNGGNRSVVANDFTQILSDGIGVWCTGSGSLIELVSVFSYYAHIGYLSEDGGKIRATNGNSSYGTYGTVAEGYDPTETPLTGTVNNRNQSAQVAAAFAGQAQNKILVLEYLNAGQGYSLSNAPNAVFSGAGTGVSTVFDEFRDNAIFEAFVSGTTYSAGGSGYITGGNQAQSGSSTTITIASNDQRTAANYVGMRVIITSGTGVGQYGYIQSYDNIGKIATVYKESTSTAGWDHVIPGTAISLVLDSTTVYSIEPRVTFSTPKTVLGPTSISSNTSAIAYGNGKFVTVSRSGSGVMQYSTTGTSWTTGTGTVALNYPTVAFAAANNTFVAIDNSGSTYGYSTDGIAWTTSTLPTSVLNSKIISAGDNVAYVSYGDSTRTNLLTFSEQFDNADWSKTRSSIAANTATAPDGTLTADTFIEDTSATNSHYIYQFVPVTNALVYTKSIYVKAKERSYCAIQFSNRNGAFTSGGAYFNLNTGVVTYVDASITNASISNIGNGWYRISASSTATATANSNIVIHLSSGATDTAYTGDGTSGIYIWGAQFETGSRASGYIKSVATQGTATTELLTSSNGTTWNALGSPPMISTRAVAYGAGTYVIIKSNTDIAYSYNGLTWTSVTALTNTTWADVIYGNGRFVAIANSGANAVYSVDGITWVESTLPASATWSYITYNQGVFFAVSNSVNAATSNDGVNWTLQTLPVNLWTFAAIGTTGTNITAVAIDTSGNTQSLTIGAPALGRAITGSGKIGGIKIWNPGSGYLAVPTISQFTGSISGTTLSITAVSSLTSPSVGMLLSGAYGNIAANSTITAQNVASFTGFISNFSLTVTNVASGVISNGLVLTGTNVASSTTIIGSDTAIFTGSILGTTLTVSAMTSGVIYAGMTLTGGTIPTGTYIVSNISGAGTNSTWTVSTTVTQTSTPISGIRYTVNISQTLESTSITGTSYTVNVSQTVSSVYMQGYTDGSAVVTVTDPNATTAAVITCRTGNGVLGNPSFISRGTNYQTSTTICTISGGNGYADVYQVNKYLTVSGVSATPYLGASISIGADSTRYKVVNVTSLGGSAYTIQVSPAIDRALTPTHGTAVSIRQKYSQVRLTGHDYLLIGTGNKTTTNYPNVDLTTAASFKQVQENNLGRVFVTSTDQDGNFSVGGLFGVQQATGIVTVSADLFNLTGISSLALGGVQVGVNQVAITQFSTDSYFVANSDSIVPTERAIKSYVARAISAGGSNAQTSILTAGTVQIGPNKIGSSISGRVKINNKLNFTKGVDGQVLAMNYFKQSWM